jgi:hypothetical protein
VGSWQFRQTKQTTNAYYLTKGLIMANKITVTELGGAPQIVDSAATVRELANQLGIEDGLEVSINGKSATYDSSLSDYNFVSFGKKVKGGNKRRIAAFSIRF